MKANTHPKWYPQAKVKCACGNTFTSGSTMEFIEIEVCSKCHPFYTGQMKFVDTAGRVDAFKTKQAKAQKKVLSKKQKRDIKKKKRVDRELKKPDTLEELRNQISKKRIKKTIKTKKAKKL